MHLSKIVLVCLVFISAQTFSMSVELDKKEDDKYLCQSQIKEDKTMVNLKGCCSHHKGIKQCGLDLIETTKGGNVKCVDGHTSGCRL